MATAHVLGEVAPWAAFLDTGLVGTKAKVEARVEAAVRIAWGHGASSTSRRRFRIGLQLVVQRVVVSMSCWSVQLMAPCESLTPDIGKKGRARLQHMPAAHACSTRQQHTPHNRTSSYGARVRLLSRARFRGCRQESMLCQGAPEHGGSCTGGHDAHKDSGGRKRGNTVSTWPSPGWWLALSLAFSVPKVEGAGPVYTPWVCYWKRERLVFCTCPAVPNKPKATRDLCSPGACSS